MNTTNIFSKSWSSCPKDLADIRKNMTDVCQQCGYAEQDINAIVLAIDEACTNIIRYAYNNCNEGKIKIEIKVDGDFVNFRLLDFAEKVDKKCINIESSSLLKPGGLGVILIHRVMDSVEFVHTNKCLGNILELKKRRPKEDK